ncbi:O-antigen ligase family protein [Belnapia rosea]|uniref:O-antigen ligase family protein n=1 Tax=Belnapia rosea TaxID=938405 RepID=UPI00088236CC|nr:O-antigen ligase family protein [Belnapia rosea]SDB43167.1 O-antigen ligase [Belnapia rosea]
MTHLAWSPSLPVAVALAAGPAAGVLQSKALAPIAVAALLLSVLAHRRRHGAWPWPRGAAAWLAIGLFGWAAVTALWAIEPLRALGTSLQLGGFVALGAAAARAVAEDDEAARRRLMLAATGGLTAGILLAGLDAATGNAIRAAVRGLKEIPPTLAFGLKPAASAMALWLPLVAAAPLSRWLRAAVIAAGATVLVLLPGEAAKLAVLSGLLVGGLALLLPRGGRIALGTVLAAALIAMPMLLGPVLARGVPAAGIPPSAAHRLLIWDFVITRIADRPLLGWGMEASRAVPGHRSHPGPEAMARFGLGLTERTAWLSGAELLPLHPHNGALQLRLELGWPGVLIAAALAAALALACASPVALAMLAAGAVTAMLSFGAWQEWWVGAELLAVAGAAGLPRRPSLPPPGGSPPPAPS